MSEIQQNRESYGYSPEQDPVKQYLLEIGKVALLNAEEEVELSQAIEAGLYAAALLEAQDFSRATEEELLWFKQAGEEAKNHLFEANLRLVVSLAKRYSHSSLDLLDRIQDGNVGLDRAVKKFDYTKGFKFSTYATWWIRQAVTRAIAEKERVIRLPVHVVEKVNKISRVERELERSNGVMPTLEQLAEELEMGVEEVADLKHYSQMTIPLDAPVGVDGDLTVGDLIVEHGAHSPDETVQAQLYTDKLNDVLDTVLDERKAGIIRLRHGFYGEVHTQAEVGKIYGLSGERIRQLERQAHEELRLPLKDLEDR